MEPNLKLSDVTFTPATDDNPEHGLLGFVECTFNDQLRIDGITMRHTSDGRLAISFPSRIDRHGVRHHLVRPINDAARRNIQRQILAALGVEVAS